MGRTVGMLTEYPPGVGRSRTRRRKYLIESGCGKAYSRPTHVRESMRATAAVGWL